MSVQPFALSEPVMSDQVHSPMHTPPRCNELNTQRFPAGCLIAYACLVIRYLINPFRIITYFYNVVATSTCAYSKRVLVCMASMNYTSYITLNICDTVIIHLKPTNPVIGWKFQFIFAFMMVFNTECSKLKSIVRTENLGQLMINNGSISKLIQTYHQLNRTYIIK